MNWKLMLLPVAIPVELVVTTGTTLLGHTADTGFGDWCLDRKPGDPSGKLWQTRAEVLNAKTETI